MSPNRTSQLTGPAYTSSNEGFARRRINDLAGLAAIISTAVVVGLITGVDTPAFAIALFAAIGGLAFAEQRLSGAGPQQRSTRTLAGWHARA